MNEPRELVATSTSISSVSQGVSGETDIQTITIPPDVGEGALVDLWFTCTISSAGAGDATCVLTNNANTRLTSKARWIAAAVNAPQSFLMRYLGPVTAADVSGGTYKFRAAVAVAGVDFNDPRLWALFYRSSGSKAPSGSQGGSLRPLGSGQNALDVRGWNAP